MLNLLILLIIVFLLIFLSMVWPPDSPWAPWWRTNKKTAKAICKLAKINKKDFVIDLGCGDGEALLEAGKLGARGLGVEIDPTRVFIARLRILVHKLNKRIFIKRSNLFEENLSEASVIIVYLVPKTLNRLLPKFKKQLKKGTRIVSYRYDINLKSAKIDKENNLRLYII